jgi:hypothetical protein
MSQEARRWLEIFLMVIGFALSGIAAYYNMDARVLLVEQQVKVESAARIGMQTEMSNRMEKLDMKMDRVGDKMERLTEAFYERRLNDAATTRGR